MGMFIRAGKVVTARLTDLCVTTAKIAANAVTLAKMATGTQGGTLYFGAAGALAELAAGTSGKFLKTQGPAADPIWASLSLNWIEETSATTAGVTGSTYSTLTASGTKTLWLYLAKITCHGGGGTPSVNLRVNGSAAATYDERHFSNTAVVATDNATEWLLNVAQTADGPAIVFAVLLQGDALTDADNAGGLSGTVIHNGAEGEIHAQKLKWTNAGAQALTSVGIEMAADPVGTYDIEHYLLSQGSLA